MTLDTTQSQMELLGQGVPKIHVLPTVKIWGEMGPLMDFERGELSSAFQSKSAGDKFPEEDSCA